MIKEKDLDNLEDLLVDEGKKFVKQGSLQSPAEAQSLKYLLEGIMIIHCIRNGGMDEEGGYSGYSGYAGYSGANNGYRGGWGRGKAPMQVDYSGAMDFNGTYGARMRSPSTGRYISGYSGHSIHDRMIASLEPLYDQATSEHEKAEIDAWIKRLRTEN